MVDTASPTAPAARPGLYRMSTTAGVGPEGDYAAINPLAVAALVLAVAGAAAFASPLFLPVPAVALALGAAALYQIARSNGTQAGRLFAWAAVLVAGATFALVAARGVAERREAGARVAELQAVTGDLGAHLAAGRYEQAHALFAARFRERVPAAEFRATLEGYQRSPAFGKIEQMELGPLVSATTSAEGASVARGTIRLKFAPNAETPLEQGETRGEYRQQVTFLREQGAADWRVLALRGWFANPNEQGGGGGGDDSGGLTP